MEAFWKDAPPPPIPQKYKNLKVEKKQPRLVSFADKEEIEWNKKWKKNKN